MLPLKPTVSIQTHTHTHIPPLTNMDVECQEIPPNEGRGRTQEPGGFQFQAYFPYGSALEPRVLIPGFWFFAYGPKCRFVGHPTRYQLKVRETAKLEVKVHPTPTSYTMFNARMAGHVIQNIKALLCKYTGQMCGSLLPCSLCFAHAPRMRPPAQPAASKPLERSSSTVLEAAAPLTQVSGRRRNSEALRRCSEGRLLGRIYAGSDGYPPKIPACRPLGYVIQKTAGEGFHLALPLRVSLHAMVSPHVPLTSL